MPFQRLCLLLFASLLMLGGCSPRYTMRLCAQTDGHVYPHAGHTYAVNLTERQSWDPLYRQIKKDMERILPDAGLKMTSERRRANVLLDVNYEDEKTTRLRTVSEPVYGRTGSVKETRGTYDKATGKYSRTTVTTPTYGITGYKDTVKEEDDYYYKIYIYASDARTGKKLWDTYISCTIPFPDSDMPTHLLQGAKEYFGSDTEKFIKLYVTINQDGTYDVERVDD
ncbi:hypothetical protein [uncultured Bilophila sp.]|uniref:hypothetical protein n=1 Tax=uncultured Bilophila sp. TaxID=529385 RepID=UPI0025D531FF|nr:hypothetical protein [uncultured Bilophila sp.]